MTVSGDNASNTGSLRDIEKQQIIAALERSGWFPNVDLSSSVETNNIITYVLTATFLNPEVAAKQAAAAAANKPIPGSTASQPAAPKR